MKTDEQLWEICLDIYREMYRKSDPPADFDELMKSGEAKKDNFFRYYYLPIEEHNEILGRHMDNHELSEREKEKISFTVTLGSGPSSVKKDWDNDENYCTS